MYDLVVVSEEPCGFTSKDMKFGDIGIILKDNGQFTGHKILRVWGGIVSLTDPSAVWHGTTSNNNTMEYNFKASGVAFPVGLYKSGQVIKLMVK